MALKAAIMLLAEGEEGTEVVVGVAEGQGVAAVAVVYTI